MSRSGDCVQAPKNSRYSLRRNVDETTHLRSEEQKRIIDEHNNKLLIKQRRNNRGWEDKTVRFLFLSSDVFIVAIPTNLPSTFCRFQPAKSLSMRIRSSDFLSAPLLLLCRFILLALSSCVPPTSLPHRHTATLSHPPFPKERIRVKHRHHSPHKVIASGLCTWVASWFAGVHVSAAGRPNGRVSQINPAFPCLYFFFYRVEVERWSLNFVDFSS